MRIAKRRTRYAAVLVIAGLALAGCGKKSSSSSNTTTTAAPAATQPSASPTTGSTAIPSGLATKDNAKLGKILAVKGAKGLTVYTLTSNGKAVACTGPCLAAWPPTGIKANGLPVYTFVQDKDSGDAYGDGLKSFGGVWHVVKVGSASSGSAGGTATTSAPTTAATTPTTASSGNGY